VATGEAARTAGGAGGEPGAAHYLTLKIPDDQLFGAIASEGALTDPQLDGIEAELLEGPLDPGRIAALALTLGRAGRPSSREALARAEARLAGAGHLREAAALRLAQALSSTQVPAAVERADRGYRFVDPERSEVLYVEDPLAAHWHQRDRWGPPLRPARERPAVWAGPRDELHPLLGAALDGRVVVVSFRPLFWQREVAPALRLTRAGLSRSADLGDLVRWSRVLSVGSAASRFGESAAYETRDGRVTLPERPSLPLPALLELMGRLLKQSRS
jgi:hypothetical protein